MRTWQNKLYFDAMPGRTKPGRPRGDFPGWLTEMQEYGIHTIVCLAPEEQVAAESPQYAEWRRHPEYELIDIPIDDFSAPEPFVAPRFWKQAMEIASKIDSGEKVFIHCGAGIGRTGMFAVAVLMQLGYSYDAAYNEIETVGSHPEVHVQQKFLRDGKRMN